VKSGGDAPPGTGIVMNWFSGRHGLSVSPMRGAVRYRGSKRKGCDATEVWAYPVEEHARRRLANQIEAERW
jgi:hypothetical protein